MKTYNNWFLACMALILAFVANLVGFAMGQQGLANNCDRFGMFHYDSNFYSCQQVKANEVVAVGFREAGK